MKISEALSVHAGLLQLAGGPEMPVKLGKFTYGVVKNIRLFEQQVVKDFREAQQKIIKDCGVDQPLPADASEEEKTAFAEKVEEANKLIMEMIESEALHLKFHALSPAILECEAPTMTAGVAHSIFPILAEESQESKTDQ